jgi:hypothetical protein
MVLRLSVIVSRSRHSIRVPARAGIFGRFCRLPVEAKQRLAKIVEHGRKVAMQRRAPPD